ncbi:MAG: protein BatD [Bacteroidetes bacterium]|nr:MAG: protein BatD [Bacteroidota bacterium]REK08166.1 MAG: protein BatD [Bacteroidota bacterium]REK32371.1 MAG: protein BatD [Bacteroidota bacterium]REK49605.1 MAG: protein BatD [Bacteroidota bacterium]
MNLNIEKSIEANHRKATGVLSCFTLLCLLLISLTTLNLYAQDEKFTASVSPQTVSVGEQVQVTFSFNGNGKNFKAPSFSGFNILAGPSQSSSVQIINGSITQSISYTYILQALSEGSFKFQGAEITGSAGRVISNAFTINVVKGSSGQQNKQDASGQGQVDGKNVFLRASVDKTNVYRGEAISVTYRLYTKVTLLNYSIDKIPAMNGFWTQDITLSQQPEFRVENVDGVNYKVADIKKLIIFPQRSGALQVESMEGDVIARVQVKRQSRSNDPFDQFFNDPFFNNPFFGGNVQDIKVPVRSEPIRINVKELPENAPQGFSGAVGRFSCEVSLDKQEVKAHEPVTLKIKINGKGNIKLIESPQVDVPPDFESYDPKENSNISANASGVSGHKTFEYLLIPRTPGEYKIPVSDFSYFDLDKKQYQIIPAGELLIKVNKGDENLVVGSGGTFSNKSDVQMLGKDIRFIKTNVPDFRKIQTPLFGTILFYSLLVSPLLLFGFLILIRRRSESLKGQSGLIKSRKANKMARKRLALAKKYLDSNQKNKFYDEVSHALWGYLSDKLQIPVSDLSKETATDALISSGIKVENVNNIISVIDKIEFTRFAGSSGSTSGDLYKDAITAISGIEEN